MLNAVTPTERRDRIKARERRRRAMQAKTRADYLQAADEFVEEVEAAAADPESPITYAESARLAGMTPQNLEQMRERYRKRHPAQQATG